MATAGQKEFKKLILREPGRTVCHKEGGNIICGTKLIVIMDDSHIICITVKNLSRLFKQTVNLIDYLMHH